MDKIRIGVIGLRFGRQLVRTLANMEDADIVALADRSFDGPEGLYDYAAHYGAAAYLDGVEMMRSEDLDAVVLCTSPSTRAELMRCAISEGVAMFVEKPWATNVKHAKELAALCRDSSAPVMTAFSFRYHPAIVHLRQLMAGSLGPGWLLNGSYIFNWQPDPDGWLWDPDNGGGFINENSCHLFDGVCSLLGKPVSVMAEASTHLQAPSENTAAVTLRFAGGAIAALTIGGVGAQAQRGVPAHGGRHRQRSGHPHRPRACVDRPGVDDPLGRCHAPRVPHPRGPGQHALHGRIQPFLLLHSHRRAARLRRERRRDLRRHRHGRLRVGAYREESDAETVGQSTTTLRIGPP